MNHDTAHVLPDVKKLYDLLMSAPVGAVVHYAEMLNALSYDVRNRRYILMQALKRASDNGALFSVVCNFGYRRLPTEDAHLIGAQARKRVRRASRLASAKITSALAIANDLSDVGRRRAYQETAALGLIAHLATDRHVHRASPPNQPLSVAETAKLALSALVEVGGSSVDRAADC